MRTKALIALALLVLLPVGVLGWLGTRLLDSERQAVEHRVQTLIDGQLVGIDTALGSYFAERRSQLLADAGKLAHNTAALRDYVRDAHLVRQVFLMDARGERLHPPRNTALTQEEQRFLERSADIWRKRDILHQATPSDAPGKTPQRSDGWYVWHWGNETDLIFWHKNTTGTLIGFELEPARVKADLIALLPDTGGSDDRLGQARVRLIDDRGSVAYQWGEFTPAATDAKALALRPLSHPLGSWQLAYYAPVLAADHAPRRLLLGSVLGVVALALGALGWFLYRENMRAARLAAQRVSFVNQVSHELKTPLTNIRMYAELLSEELDPVDEKPRRYLDIMVAESQRLSRLILNVLSFGRMQRETLNLHRQDACVDTVVAATLEAFRAPLASKGVAIDFTPGAPATVRLDRDALEQILNNLFSNVEKYAAGGGRLQVSTTQDAERSVIRVQDHGPGIPAHERERIFGAFYRSSAKLSDATGTGIGLTIARELARLHGGDLVVRDSERGACFELTLRTGSQS